MHSRYLSAFILSLSFLGQQALASETSFDERTTYLRAASVFNDVMKDSGGIDLKKLAKEDQAFIEYARKNASNDVKIQFSDSNITIQSKEMGITIEIKDNDLYIGGVKHKYNANISRVENIRNWAKNWQKDHKKSASFLSLGMSQAIASEAVVLGTPAAISIDKVNTFADKALSITEGLAGAGAFVGGSAAVGAVSSAAGIFTGFMVGSLVAMDVVTCEAMARSKFFSNVNRERLNCYTAGLSLIGMNPRDRLYLQGIRCEGSQITVDLESQRNIKATRTFKFTNGTVTSVEESHQMGRYSDKRENKSVQFSNPPNEKQKEILEALKPEMNYYQNLCQHPDLLEKFRKEAETAHSKTEIITTTPSGTK